MSESKPVPDQSPEQDQSPEKLGRSTDGSIGRTISAHSEVTGDFSTPREPKNKSDSGEFTVGPVVGSAATADFTIPKANPHAVTGDYSSVRSSAVTIDNSSIGGHSLDGSETPSLDPATGRPFPIVAGYRILSELGRGGMGVVYKARQRALNRLVALKMVLAGGHAGPDQLARFHLEAQAVASLQHQNIVQIYEVGECEGLPFFSLEFVDGSPLDKALAGKPQAPKDAAHLMEVLARAMHFAHLNGIVHRDLKPANVLLTSDGEPKITDFGLAKKLENDSGQTKSGTLMGTPSYMAPEQARGQLKELGPLADVHSLGAILYEMLVGRPPFLGSTPMETIMQVINQEPVPPSRLIPRLPPDIETICLKCLQKEPEKRYRSAEELADDCRRFLAGEPIRSRPISAPERFWRWCKRNPRIAVLGATVAALLVLVAISSTVSALTIARERDAKEEQRQLAETAKEQAEAAKQLAETAKLQADQNAKVADDQAGLALNTMQILVDKVQKQLEDAPHTQKLKRELLETAMAGLKQVATKAKGSTSVEATMLAAHMRMGYMFRQLGAAEEAMQEFTLSYDVAKRRAIDRPQNDASQANLAAVLLVLGEMTQELRRDMVTARAHFEQSLKILQDLHRRPRSTEGPISQDSLTQSLAEAHTRVGVTRLRLGEPAQALPSFEQAMTLREQLAARLPDSESVQQDLARSYNAIGEVSFLLGNTAQARKYYDQGLASREAMLKSKPDNVRFKIELINTSGNYGDLCLRIRDLEAAKTYFDRSLALCEELVALDDQNIDYRRALGTALYRLGAWTQRARDADSAQPLFQRCLEVRQSIAKLDAKNDVWQMELMLALAHCGQHQLSAQIAEVAREETKDRELLFNIARGYAQCAASTRTSDKVLSDKYVTIAISTLRDAIAEGYHDGVAFQLEPDLDPLRDNREFQELQQTLTKP